jgi:hypothetical protein
LFTSPQALREAWERHRDECMRHWGCHARRPQGWWAFDTELEYPGYARERSFLWRAGIFGPEEKLEVEAEWRQAFDAAREMNAHDRREHLAFHDVPPELAVKWEAGPPASSPQAAGSGTKKRPRSGKRRRTRAQDVSLEKEAMS